MACDRSRSGAAECRVHNASSTPKSTDSDIGKPLQPRRPTSRWAPPGAWLRGTIIDDLLRFDEIHHRLGEIARAVGNAGKSWYKLENDQEIPIQSDNANREIRPLSEHSSAVKRLRPTGRKMLDGSEEKNKLQ